MDALALERDISSFRASFGVKAHLKNLARPLRSSGKSLPPSSASAVKPPAPTNPTALATAPAAQPHPTASSPPTAIPLTSENRATASQPSPNAAPAVTPATSPSAESARSTSQQPRQFADAQLTGQRREPGRCYRLFTRRDRQPDHHRARTRNLAAAHLGLRCSRATFASEHDR